jgi:hypothetical protein
MPTLHAKMQSAWMACPDTRQRRPDFAQRAIFDFPYEQGRHEDPMLSLKDPSVLRQQAYIDGDIGREGSKYGMDDYLVIKYLCLGGLG